MVLRTLRVPDNVRPYGQGMPHSRRMPIAAIIVSHRSCRMVLRDVAGGSPASLGTRAAAVASTRRTSCDFAFRESRFVCPLLGAAAWDYGGGLHARGAEKWLLHRAPAWR